MAAAIVKAATFAVLFIAPVAASAQTSAESKSERGMPDSKAVPAETKSERAMPGQTKHAAPAPAAAERAMPSPNKK